MMRYDSDYERERRKRDVEAREEGKRERIETGMRRQRLLRSMLATLMAAGVGVQVVAKTLDLAALAHIAVEIIRALLAGS